MKIKLLLTLVLLCGVGYGQIPTEVKNLTKHRAPAPPSRYQGKFPSAWPCTIVGSPLPYGQEKITLTSDDFGKTWKTIGSLCVSDFTTYRLVTARLAHAQQPQKPDAKPFTLSAEGTASMLELNRQIGELQLRIENLKLQQQLVLAREHAPEEYPRWEYDPVSKRVVVLPPVKVEAKPSP